MSLIEDLDKLHISLKIIAVSFFLIPFWDVAIFLFNNDFYRTSDIIIITAMCLILSITSTSLLSVMFYKAAQEKKTHTDDPSYYMATMTQAVVVLIIWISILIFGTYTMRFIFNISIQFYYFIVLYYAPLLLLSGLYFIEKKRKKKKKQLKIK